LVIRPDDQPSQLLVRRIEKLMKAPPPEGWQAVTVYDYK